MVAVQAMLTLVEPQSSGIGGGAFLLHHDAETGALEAFDGRETAPAAATERLFLDDEGAPLGFAEALVGGRSVGVPGVMRMLEAAHRRHGRLPWADLLQPAIARARDGFEVTPRLHRLLARDAALRAMPAARALFYPEGGRAKAVGRVHRNPKLAEVLTAIAERGADALYEGPIAARIVDAVQAARQPPEWVLAANHWLLDFGLPFGLGVWATEPAPGLLTRADLAGYRPIRRAPVCVELRARYRVCGHPPPTSGGITTLQIIGMLQHHDLERHPPVSAEAAHLLAEAGRLAFADRNRYIGDPGFVDVPTEALLDPAYLRARAALISEERPLEAVEPGEVPGASAARFSDDPSPSLPSTSHFVIFDAEGDVVSMTTSVENAFGSRLVVEGFVLNNQLTDFAFVPERGGRPVANAVAPGKRPRSSMSPLMVYDLESGAPVLAIGSPGGSRIIGYTAQAALGVLLWGLDPQEAVELPHVVGRGRAVELERGGWPDAVVARLEAMGHEVLISEHTSGLHAVSRDAEGTLRGGADPRREGVALGERAASR